MGPRDKILVEDHLRCLATMDSVVTDRNLQFYLKYTSDFFLFLVTVLIGIAFSEENIFGIVD